MAGSNSTRPLCVAMILTLAACSDYADYPRLLPMDQLTAAPRLPANAAEAASSPATVNARLQQQRGALQSRAAAAAASGPDASDLTTRAEALRKRARALSETPMDQADCPDGQSCPETATP